jgi:hypothetical protein
MLWRCKEPERKSAIERLLQCWLITKISPSTRANGGSRRYRPQSVRQRLPDKCIRWNWRTKRDFQPNFNVFRNTNIRLYSWASWVSQKPTHSKVNHSPATEVSTTTTAGKESWLYAGTFSFEKDKGNNIIIERLIQRRNNCWCGIISAVTK